MSMRKGREYEDLKATIAFLGMCLAKSCPVYCEDDVTIVKNGSAYQLYAARDFAAKAFRLMPESGELKDAHWTYNRSAIVRTGENVFKNLVLDGRVRANPEEDGKHSFSLFWLVTMEDEEDRWSECNLEQKYARFDMDITSDITELKRGSPTANWSTAAMAAPQYPYLENPKPLKKGTRLVCAADPQLVPLLKQKADQQLRVKEKEAEAATKREAADKRKAADDGADGGDGAKRVR